MIQPRRFWLWVFLWFAFLAGCVAVAFSGPCFGQDDHVCGGCEHGHVVRTVAVNNEFTYWIGPGEMYGIDRAETVRLIRKSYRELSSVAGWTWSETDNEGKASVRIYIAGNDHHRLQLRQNGKLFYVFGRASTAGWVYINHDRKVDFSKRRYLEGLVQHETLHTLGWKHGDSGCIMHYGDYTDWFCKTEVLRLQRERGPPTETIHPPDRVQAGKRIRAKQKQIAELKARWQTLVDQRTASIEAGTWLEKQKTLQPRILALVEQMRKRWAEMAELNRNWHRINNAWKGVPGIVQLGN